MPSFLQINNIDDMENYLLTMLGGPINNVEMTKDQIDQCIYDAVQYFWRYNYSEGNYMDVMIFQTTAGKSDYSLSAGEIRDVFTSAIIDNITDVYDFSVRDGLDGINTLFSPQHILLYNEFAVAGNYPGGPGTGGDSGGLTLTNFYTSMMYIESIKEAFGKMYRVIWSQAKQSLKVIPTPADNVFGALILYRRELAEQLYNNPLVKKLALAKAKILLGTTLGKYTGTLPDGLSINYNIMYDRGVEEEKTAEDWIRSETAGPDFMVG